MRHLFYQIQDGNNLLELWKNGTMVDISIDNRDTTLELSVSDGEIDILIEALKNAKVKLEKIEII